MGPKKAPAENESTRKRTSSSSGCATLDMVDVKSRGNLISATNEAVSAKPRGEYALIVSLHPI